MNKIKKYLYVLIGFLSLAIGSIGLVLPVIPTTPFLLFCFIRGSEKFNKRFKSTKIYKNHVESFINEKAMTMKRKITILSLVSIMISIPIILVDNLHVRIFLIALICIKFYYFIFKIKTIKPNNIINIK